MTRIQWIAHLTFIPAFVAVHFVTPVYVYVFGFEVQIWHVLFYGTGGAIAMYWIMDRWPPRVSNLSRSPPPSRMQFDEPE